MFKKYTLLTLSLLLATTACVTIHSGGKTYKLSDLVSGSKGSSSGKKEVMLQKSIQICKAVHEDDVNQLSAIIQAHNNDLKQTFYTGVKGEGRDYNGIRKKDYNYPQYSDGYGVKNMCMGIGEDNPYRVDMSDAYHRWNYNEEKFGYLEGLVVDAYYLGSCNMAKFLESLQSKTYRTNSNKVLQSAVITFGKTSRFELKLKQLIVNTVKCGADINTKLDGYYLLDYIDKHTDDVFDKLNRAGKLGELIDILVQLGAKRTGEGQKGLSAKRQDEARAAARRANCEHLYEGRAVKVKECFFGCYYASGFEVVGFSKQRGVASVRKGKYGDIKEVSCSDIEE